MAGDRGVLFDLDGVVVNTETLKRDAHAETAARLGGRLPTDFYPRVMGRSREAVAEEAIRAGGIASTPHEYNEAFEATLAAAVPRKLQANAGVVDLLDRLRQRGYRTAVVSSSSRRLVVDILRQAGLDRLFEVVVTADDVSRPKPSPDAYLAALHALSLRAGQAVVFEDSESGLLAAQAAGLPVFAVVHELNGSHDLSAARARITGFQDPSGIVRLVDSLLATGRT